MPTGRNDIEPRGVREPLTRERIVQAALDLADNDGIAALSMRKLAQQLGVEAMSLYNHVENKDDILNGMVDAVFAEIGLPVCDVDWKSAMRQRAGSLRAALVRRPWAIGLLESRRRPGPATLTHHDAVIGCLRRAGFSLAMTSHAYSLIDSFIYGFALQQVSFPTDFRDDTAALATAIMRPFPPDTYPHLAEFTTGHVLQPGYDYGAEFDFGLELILDAINEKQAMG